MQEERSVSIKVDLNIRKVKGKPPINRFYQPRKGKHHFKKKRKNMAKVKCFHYGNKGHIASNCSEPKKVKKKNSSPYKYNKCF